MKRLILPIMILLLTPPARAQMLPAQKAPALSPQAIPLKLFPKICFGDGSRASAFKAGYEKGIADAYGLANGEIHASGLSSDEWTACFTCGGALAREGLKIINRGK